MTDRYSHSIEESNLRNETNEVLLHIKEMGFLEPDIRRAADIVDAEINKDSVDAILDVLSNPDLWENTNAGEPRCLTNEPGPKYAVQIISPHQDAGQGYVINEAEIKRIFQQPSVANTPVAIYSVAGAFRQGKSFILNFFVRYMRCQRNRTSCKWLEPKQDVLDKGFVWRGGMNKHTQGIWILDEPFFFDTPDGKVALFLMDTQGSFDPHSSVKDCSVIFGLSTLISSVQIYNVSKQLQENTLQHLQLFTEYGKAAKQVQKGDQKAFQDLIFLIRDWSDPKYTYDFNGGEKVLQSVLQAPISHQDTESVRKHLEDSFERLSCCLMPYPGEKVGVRSDEQKNCIRLEDVEEKFLTAVDVLVHNLFTPKEILLKKIGNRSVCGKDLVQYALAYFKVFASGEMPEVGTVLQGTAKANILTSLMKCKEKYRIDMIKKFEDFDVNENQMLKTHKRCKDVALKNFRQRTFGDEELIKEYTERLNEEIECELITLRQTRKLNEEVCKLKVKKVATFAAQQFSTGLDNCASGEFAEEQSLEEIVDAVRKAAFLTYTEKTKGHPKTIVGKYQKKLEDMIKQALDRFIETNKHRKIDLQRQLEAKSAIAINHYMQTMHAECKDEAMTEERFENVHQTSFASALKVFDESNVGKNTEQGRTERNHLLSNIETTKTKYRKANEMNEKLSRSETLETMKEAKQKYVRAMEKEEYVDDNALEELHFESKLEVIVFISSLETEHGSSFVQKCLSQFEEFIEIEYRNIKTKHFKQKTKIVNRLQSKSKDVYRKYQSKMDQLASNYVKDFKLKTTHEREKSDAIRHFVETDEQTLPQEDFERIQEQLESKINEHYEFLKQKNLELKEHLLQVAKKDLEECKADYLNHMISLCEDGHLNNDQLRIYHEKRKMEILQRYRRSSDPFLIENTRNKEVEIDALYRSVKEKNKRCVIL